jgi:hypothetical protein
MRFFWQISCEITIWTIRKMTAARTRIWGCKGHYMELNLGTFGQMGAYKWPDFRGGKLEGFTGVSLISTAAGLPNDLYRITFRGFDCIIRECNSVVKIISELSGSSAHPEP